MDYMTWLKLRGALRGSWVLLALLGFLILISLKNGIGIAEALGQIWPLSLLFLVHIGINYYKLSK